MDQVLVNNTTIKFVIAVGNEDKGYFLAEEYSDGRYRTTNGAEYAQAFNYKGDAQDIVDRLQDRTGIPFKVKSLITTSIKTRKLVDA